MESEEVLKLFDYCWFEVFMSKHNNFPAKAKSSLHEQVDKSTQGSSKIYHGATNLQIRSLSDRCLGFNARNYIKEEEPKLQKIVSGKEVEFSKVLLIEEDDEEKLEKKNNCSSSRRRRRRRRKKGMMRRCRSFSALEFDEVKGFIDLGFVFTEEDNNTTSSLVSIIPGLQKWSKMSQTEKFEVSRGDFNNKRKIPMMNWKIPSNGEVNMKDHLRVWAETVASTVRL
ncbi:hypothetical protein BUALT_Bualt18G0031900 [Buddleja alternifolia]|uniref:Uncharacterized protein n=1 Tax=Buddleja alternifolia TaxID=168488 RepID=A0AAV6WA36_9LAMI|nr:hypothetical protein BUALT_Bualt18G0031900 [Buddleja alternifolia]